MLCQLEDLLTTNPLIPSAQPQSFYELVVMDFLALLDLGGKHYRSELKLFDGDNAPELPPIEGPVEPLAVADASDVFDVVDDASAGEKPLATAKGKAKAKRKAKPRAKASQPFTSSCSSSNRGRSRSRSSRSSESESHSAASFDVVAGRSHIKSL